jgi:hypothetical protein
VCKRRQRLPPLEEVAVVEAEAEEEVLAIIAEDPLIGISISPIPSNNAIHV